MTDDEHRVADGDDGIVGLAVDEAAERVLADDESRDPDTVRAALANVAEDGVVTESGIENALAHLSKVVSTPETRTELAAMALSDARETAADVDDVPSVASRLEAFEARLETVEARAEALGPELGELVGREGGAYATARGIQRLTAEANDVQRAADELQVDIEEFERWVNSPIARYEELEGDADALAESLGDLVADVDALAAAADSANGADGEGDEDGADGEDPALAWAEATVSQRVMALLAADLRAELADLRTLAEREERLDEDSEELDDLTSQLDDLESRVRGTGERLDGLAEPAWRDRFSDRLAATERALDGFEPPVDWGEVGATVDDHRALLYEG